MTMPAAEPSLSRYLINIHALPPSPPKERTTNFRHNQGKFQGGDGI